MPKEEKDGKKQGGCSCKVVLDSAKMYEIIERNQEGLTGSRQ